jgi:molybdopterin molybdotransferase
VYGGYNVEVAALRVADARACVLERVRRIAPVEVVSTLEAAGRVLAEDIPADRDYPPVARSIRDGFAVRSTDQPKALRVIGEVRAGESFSNTVGPNEAVEIMTGAPVPQGADAVVMVEHVERNDGRISTDRAIKQGDFINAAGTEARRGDVVIHGGRRLGFADIAMAATVGRSQLSVYTKPRVAIIATGDEVVGVDETPREFQVRNSNAWSLAVQVASAGGIPNILPVARDTLDATRELIERGRQSDLLLLSGGVSAGKYDVVETVLADLGAEFFFDRVAIQPGQPLVFGRCRETFFFGLPGNPASTMVTFEVFARAALERLAGVDDPEFRVVYGRLTAPFRHKPGLTRFLPALLGNGTGALTPLPWHGSSDVPALARANAFLIAAEDRESWDAGDWMPALLK